MGRLEDELEKIRQELEALDTDNSAGRTAARRQERLTELVGAIQRGDDLDSYDPAEVERVRDALILYEPAVKRVLDRLTASGGRLGQDGGLRLD